MTDTQPQQQIDEAFAAVHTFKGRTLEAFTFSRQAAWQRLGLHNVESTLEAATAIVYLCSLGERIEVSAVTDKAGREIIPALTGIDLMQRARGPALEEFRARMDAWAASEDIGLNNEAGQEAVNVGTAIFMETKVSRFRPAVEGGGAASPNV